MHDAIHVISTGHKSLIPTSGSRAVKAVCRDRGISVVTFWRWRKRGWVTTVNISGKIYVDLQSLADFDRRAATGEFSKAPVGAADVSSKARAEKELGQRAPLPFADGQLTRAGQTLSNRLPDNSTVTK